MENKQHQQIQEAQTKILTMLEGLELWQVRAILDSVDRQIKDCAIVGPIASLKAQTEFLNQ